MQTGTCALTLQLALTPHRPGQGSTHLLLEQVLSVGQSWLNWHSGRQLGGEPIMAGKQLQSQRVPAGRGGLLYNPQGLGLHGSSATTGSTAETCKTYNHAFTYALQDADIS